MQHTTRNKFIVAVAAGALTCGGAIATATVSNADQGAPTGSSSSASGTPSTDPTTDPTNPSTTTTSTSPSSGTTSPSVAHVTVVPTLQVGVHGLAAPGFRIDGVIYAGDDPIQYTSHEIYLDGKLVNSGDRAVDDPAASLRSIHTSFDPLLRHPLPVSPGAHVVKVHLWYATGPGENDDKEVTVSRTFQVGPKDSPSSSPTTQPGEPPTPSPKTTQLGVTG
jgi:hypothetical protein